MQYKINFIKLFTLLVFLVLLYFSFPNVFNIIDANLFLFLNKFFLDYKFSRYIFGFLSHKNESWINVIVMLGVNILSILTISESQNNTKGVQNNALSYAYSYLRINSMVKKKIIANIIYCWLSFQVFLLFNNIFFQKILHFNRNSPSVIFHESIKLSVVLNNLNIKDYSNNSFPAGHALILIYWALFINLQQCKLIKIVSWFLVILFVLPRIVTGAHWVSDTIFSLLLGWIYFNISMWFANNYEQIKKYIY